jgi:hypothetical protein
MLASPFVATAQNTVFKIPPVKIPLDVKDQSIATAASAIPTISSREQFEDIEPSAYRRPLWPAAQPDSLLSTQLDKDDRCGERIAIQNATLKPAEPASIAVVQLHVERWVCVKVLGKQAAKKCWEGTRRFPSSSRP